MMWPFRKRQVEPTAPPPELVTYRFIPQFDITTLELADMLANGIWGGPHICERQTWENVPDNIRRHLPLEKS